MATGDAARRYLESGMAATMPQMRQQQETMRRILGGHGQRIGSKGAVQQARKSVEGYATQAGNVAAKLGAEAERMGQQQEQFEKGLALREKQFGELQKQNELNQLLRQYQATGVWTPEMLDAFGYDPTKQNELSRKLEQLGLSQGSGLGPGVQAQGAASGPFGRNNEMLFRRAMAPGPQFSNKAQRNQQAWLRSQFG